MERAESRSRGAVEPDDTATRSRDDEWLVVMNPTSGSADHRERVRKTATEHGYRVEETAEAGDAMDITRAAVRRGINRIAACGGDGTLNEVVRGIVAEDALDRTTLGVLPVGTANIFARNVGIDGVRQGFELLESGETRRIDLGMAGDRPFVVSCVAGLTAEASAATTAEMKQRFGSLAFFLTGVREAISFDGLELDVAAVADGEETTWSGNALGVLVGNVRQFAKQGGQANAEDGLFEVAVVEDMPAPEALTEAAIQRLFGRDTPHVVRLRATQLTIRARQDEPIDYSLDGEIYSHDEVVLHVNPRALSVRVGPDYEPTPE